MKKLTREEYIERVDKIHNGKYDYSETEYRGGKEKITVICPTHGIFKCNPSDHLHNKSGCPKCAGCGYYGEDANDYFISRAKIIHSGKYNYSKVNYINAKDKIIITCPIHGDFLQKPNNHLEGSGCPSCGVEEGRDKRKASSNEIIDNLKIIHNNRYEYPEQGEISLNSKFKIRVICPIHGEFKQNIINHYYRGNGCEKCGNNKISKGEERIEKFLLEKNIEHIREAVFEECINPKTNRKLPFDFYLPKHNICIEYDGRQHFEENPYYRIGSKELMEIQLKDTIKNDFCRNKGIDLIRISYLEFNKITNIIENEI